MEAVRRELAGVRESLDGDRDLLVQGEREAIEARVRAEVLSEVAVERQRRWDELVARGRRAVEREARGESGAGSSGRYREIRERLRALDRSPAGDDDGEGW